MTDEKLKAERKRATGAVAANFHTGSRSEILADYFFSSLGTVTPVRRQDDYGVDLFCTIDERIGARQWAREYYSVQVKSTSDPWVLEGEDSVRWLLEHPNPLFLCIADKQRHEIAVYSTVARFSVFTRQQPRLVLVPGCETVGTTGNWSGGNEVALSAPVIRFALADLVDPARVAELTPVFRQWIDLDRQNLIRRRTGLFRFRGHCDYKTNEMPSGDSFEMGEMPATATALMHGLHHLAEAAECLGGQCAQLGDMSTAIRASLLIERIHGEYKEAFEGNPFWLTRVPGVLGQQVASALGVDPYLWAGLDDVVRSLDAHPRVAAALSAAVKATP